MHLTPREVDKLLIFSAGELARKRRARGLNSPTAPQSPNRSATADKRVKQNAKRKNTEMKARRILKPSFLSLSESYHLNGRRVTLHKRQD